MTDLLDFSDVRMMRKRMMYLLGIAVLVSIGSLAWNLTARAAYESAEYKVVESDGKFEIREYPDLMLAATSSRVDSQGRDGSFMKLFSYISGANESEEKIAMTTPVFMEKGTDQSQMGFVVPKEVATKGVPTPTGEGVAIRKRAGGRFAVYRFSGQLEEKSARESEEKLRQWMTSKGMSATSDSSESSQVESAAYDPPFTPGPLRRNEVLIRLK